MNIKRKSLSLSFIVLALTAFGQGKATVSESAVTMNTYPYSDPDPVPDPQSKIYPYFLFDGYSATSAPKEWKQVVLENDYIKVTLFPEVGGKIWGAFDKINQKEFVYTNDAVKFRNIAMRGPWTSGGIEFNFGIIGHEPTTSSPVDYLTRENNDGSVSCFIASYDWITGNYWSVEVRVQPDKAYFTTKSTVYNYSSMDVPYYHWMNGAFPAQNNPEFIYPGNTYIGHGGDAHPFPNDEKGRAISWYEKNNFEGSKSYHVLGNYNGFYGIYWHGTDFGSFHLTNYDEKLGMKIFLWSLARDGAIWENLLTDRKGQYIELQSGKMWHQPTYSSGMTPFKNNSIKGQATDNWLEYWFPAQGIKGAVKTSSLGALNFERENGKITLYFSPLEKKSTVLRLYDQDKLIREIPMELDVLKTWKSVADADIKEGNLKIRIGDNLLEYSENPADNVLSRPKKLPSDFDWESAEGLTIKGEQAMNSHMMDDAENYLCKALAKDKYHKAALTRLSSLYIQQARYIEALSMLKTVLSLDAYDAEGNYLYGMCNRLMGNMTDAKDGFSIASNSMMFRSAALEQLGEIFASEKDMTKAEHYARRSLVYNNLNIRSRQLLSAVCRMQGKQDEASAAISPVLESTPLFPGARYESYRNGKQSRADFISLERCELPDETFMELAAFYEQIAMYDDALDILSMSSSPLAKIRSAFILDKMGKDFSGMIKEAEAASPDFVLPFRSIDIEPLRFAVGKSSCWKFKYYLAQLLLSKRQTGEASRCLADCGNPDYAPYYLLLARQSDGEARLSALKKAESLDPSWRTGRDLIKYYQSANDYESALAACQKYHKLYPDNYLIALSTASSYEQMAKFKEAKEILSTTSILPYEGSSEGYVAYLNTYMGEAISLYKSKSYKNALKALDKCLVYPEELGVGKPFDDQIDMRMMDYMRYRILSAMNRGKEAKSSLDKVCSSAFKPSRSFRTVDLAYAMSLKDSGNKDKADEIAKPWKDSSDKAAQWAYAIYSSDAGKAESISGNFRQRKGCDVPLEMAVHDIYGRSIYRLFGK